MTEQKKISTKGLYMLMIRPFALPASTMPVIFGTVLAVVYNDAPFNVWYFLLAFFGMVILHSGANILSDINDYKKGLDKVPTPASGAIVRGLISIKQARTASIILFFLGTVIGLLLVYFTGYELLIIGGVGVLIGVLYTVGGKLALKYHALGDLAVFMNFGILGALGAWFVQTGEFSWIPIVWAVPMATLVIAILHANNWRDILSDKEGKIYTIASLLGDRGSLVYYAVLIFGPFVFILGLIFLPRLFSNTWPAMPLTFLITLLSLPLALKLWSKAVARREPKQPLDFVALDGATAQYNLLFGILCTVALAIQAIINII